jgi:hypothetical protein
MQKSDRENGEEQPNVEMPDKLAQKPDDVVDAIDTTSVAQGVVEDHADNQLPSRMQRGMTAE